MTEGRRDSKKKKKSSSKSSQRKAVNKYYMEKELEIKKQLMMKDLNEET
jgi:hypothetical protein